MEEKNIQIIEEEIIDDFSVFDDWMQKYEYIIEYGKSLLPMDDVYKTEQNKVAGCQSQVWLYTEFKNGNVIFQADSDAIITKGLVGLLVRVLSNHKPQDIVKAKLEFIDKIGMKEHLSPNRSNGLVSMISHMKKNAESYLHKNITGGKC
ncbi:MAG: SufE family protein [Ignavibacteriae bacterium]|nr:SufE family protein [Ignavibacteriota bacterium]